MKKLSKFGERLRELLQERNVSPPVLAKAINVQRSMINAYCRGANAPSYDNIVSLVNYFDCSADFLLGLTDLPPFEKLFPVLPFGERFREVLGICGSSQYRIEKELNLSGSVVYYWLNGIHKPNAARLIDVAENLDCSVDFLLGRRR